MTENNQPISQGQPNRNPYTLWFVILSFGAPVFAAYYMFFFGDITSFSNNGEFISPYYRIEELALKKDGKDFGEADLSRKWHLMLAVGSRCDDACKEKLINLRQITRAVKRPQKVRYAIALSAAPDADFEAFIDAEMEGVVRLDADASVLASRLPVEDGVSRMVLGDPLGNMVMMFSYELTPKLVIKDMNRLF